MLSSLLLAASLAQPTPAPTVVLNSFLESTQFYLAAAEPMVRFSTLQIGFAPSGVFKCELLVKEGDKTLHTMQFRDTIGKAGVFSMVRSRTPGSVSLGTSDGARSFEVMVDGKLAGKFDFTLKKVSGGDPLDPKTSWQMTGPWKERAYISHKPDDGYRQDAYAVFWVAFDELKPGDPTVVATLKKGSTIVAIGDKRRPSGPGYSRFEQPLIKPDRNVIGVKELAGMSGLHTLEVAQGTTVLRKWTFNFANGGIAPHALSDHLKASPTEWLAPRKMDGNAVSPFLMHWLTLAK